MKRAIFLLPLLSACASFGTFQTSTSTSALIAGEPIYEMHLEDFVEDVDAGDFAPAFKRAQKACYEAVGGGCTIKPACRHYAIKSPIEACAPMHVSGCGGGDLYGTTFDVSINVTPFHLYSPGQCPDASFPNTHGDWTFERLAIVGPNTSTFPTTAIFAERPVRVRDVRIRGFIQGIRIDADVNRTPPTNANGWVIDNVRIDQAALDGVFIQGGDTSAGTTIAGAFNSNCRKASGWISALKSNFCAANPTDGACVAGYECAGVRDFSFLGNSFLGTRASSNKDLAANKAYPPFVLGHPSARGACVGCYAEGDQPPGYLSQSSNMIGGLSSWIGPGISIRGQEISGAKFINAKDPANIVETSFGQVAAGGTAIEIKGRAAGFTELRIKAEPAQKAYRLDLKNSSAAMPLRIIGTQDATKPLGTLYLYAPLTQLPAHQCTP